MLTAVRAAPDVLQGERAHSRWVCLCDCGKETIVRTTNLRATKSCGCIKSESTRKTHYKHGHTANYEYTREYIAWCGMLSRCYNKNDKGYHNYGGRGISVCDRWRGSFKSFFADVGERPVGDYSLDRINNDGDYEPSNVRWATRRQQSRNRRDTRLITIDGRTQCVLDWCREYSTKDKVVYERINRRGWDPIEAITTPIGNGRRLRKLK